MKIEKNKTSKIKTKCWDLFSKIIRITYADWRGYEVCVTCGKTDKWEKMQAGHFVDGRNNTVLLDKKLVHPQCWNCNCNLSGNKIQYVMFMKRTYGLTDKEIEKLDQKKFETKKISRKEWIIKYYELLDEYNEILSRQ